MAASLEETRIFFLVGLIVSTIIIYVIAKVFGEMSDSLPAHRSFIHRS